MKALAWIAFLIAAGVLFWVFPAFHIVRGQNPQQTTAFDAALFAQKFWKEKFLPALDQAVALPDLLSALAQDAVTARRRFGRSPGLSASSYFVVHGSGRITTVGKDRLVVALDGGAGEVDLFTGMLFGNTVRDATGLLNPSEFPNSQHFNDLAAELNRLIEEKVLPRLRSEAAPGKLVRFSGCAELSDADSSGRLMVVPVKVD